MIFPIIANIANNSPHQGQPWSNLLTKTQVKEGCKVGQCEDPY